MARLSPSDGILSKIRFPLMTKFQVFIVLIYRDVWHNDI